jgi:hypothetical protein
MTITVGIARLRDPVRRFQLKAPRRVGELCGLQCLDAATKQRGLFELITGPRKRGRPRRPICVLRAVQSEPVAGKGDAQTGSCLHERVMLHRLAIGAQAGLSEDEPACNVGSPAPRSVFLRPRAPRLEWGSTVRRSPSSASHWSVTSSKFLAPRSVTGTRRPRLRGPREFAV